MSLKDFLNYPLIKSESFNLSLYNILIILVVLGATVIFLTILKRIFRRFIDRSKLERGAYWSIFLFLRYLVWVIIIVVVLDTVGVKISVLLASLAALLVGVGLGIHQLFNDIASGVVLVVERNLQINDVIELEDGTVGKVRSIGLRTSKLETREDIIMIVPNSKFVNDKIINWSHLDFKTRFFVQVGVAYGSNVKLVTDILLECAKKNAQISNIPKPFVRFNDFGESALEFQLFFWTKESFRVENIKSALRYSIDEGFRENQIQIPFPQRDVHIKNTKK